MEKSQGDERDEFAEWTVEGLERELREINLAIFGLAAQRLPSGKSLERRATKIKRALIARKEEESRDV